MDYQFGQNEPNDENGRPTWNQEWEQNPYKGGHSSGPSGNGKKPGGGKIWTVIALICALAVGIVGGAYGSPMISDFMNRNQGEALAALESTETESSSAESETEEKSKEESKVVETIKSTTDGTNLSVQQIAETCMPSIVAITNLGEQEIMSMWGTVYKQPTESAGSGVIIGENDDELLIVTNFHVVQSSETLRVLFSYQEDQDDPDIVEAKVKDYDQSKDLAVIAVKIKDLSQETLDNIKVAKMGKSSDLALGEQVVAIGNALGYGQSVTTGIVSALNRSLQLESEDSSSTTNNTYIQTDAAINPGNSGGGLFNMQGELIGINSAKIATETVEGMGYSIPISNVQDDIQMMMSTETREVVDEDKRGYLGIQGSNVTDDINSQYGIPKGVFVSAITAGSPAERAGIQKNMVITALNGKSIATIEALKDYLSYYAAGETVQLTVMVQSSQGYEERTIDVTLGTSGEAGIESSGSKQQESQNGDNGGNGNSDQYYNNDYFNNFDYFYNQRP